MAPPPKFKEYKDDWGTTAREGYEDRGTFRPPRPAEKQRGSPLLRTVGAICIFGGLCWGAYLYTQDRDMGACSTSGWNCWLRTGNSVTLFSALPPIPVIRFLPSARKPVPFARVPSSMKIAMNGSDIKLPADLEPKLPFLL
jgi:hypothetical protein